MQAFLVATGIVALAEMGDKTQLATVALAARYHAFLPIVAGSTLGMLLANVPVVYLGEKASRNLPLKWIRLAAAAIFAGLGVAALWGALRAG
jgi:putative Ca2+/H+ antiporter (TMEM165/GDT1 family)